MCPSGPWVDQWRPSNSALVPHCQSSKNGLPFQFRCRHRTIVHSVFERQAECISWTWDWFYLFIYFFYQAKAQTEGWPLSLRSITLLTNNRLSGAVERQGGLYSCICVLIVLLIQQIVSWTICLYCKSIRGKAKAYICEHTNHRQLQQTGIKSI